MGASLGCLGGGLLQESGGLPEFSGTGSFEASVDVLNADETMNKTAALRVLLALEEACGASSSTEGLSPNSLW